MKRIEGTIYVECDLCWRETCLYETCYVCGHTVCIICLLQENFMCPVCGGDFQEPIPTIRALRTS